MKNEIIQGDSLEVLKTLEDNCIDLIASDPPYQLGIQKPGVPSSTDQFERLKKGFMGKEWDILPQVSLLKECLRVLKPGAFSFWLMTPRQDCQSEFTIRLRDAGFHIGFTPLYWAYASGFPKAGNISKMVDKRMGAEREVVGKGQAGFHSTNRVFESDDKEYGFHDITKSKTKEGQELEGSYAGYQPKPAVEVVIVAMKPLSEKTYIDQALKNKKGITWLDDVRIPFHNEAIPEINRASFKVTDDGKYETSSEQEWGHKAGSEYESHPQGRFPANLLVSDDIINDGTISKSRVSIKKGGGFGGSPYDYGANSPDWSGEFERGYNDSGSFSRYFDLDRWHINKLPNVVKETFPFMIVPKPSIGEKNEGLDDFETTKVEGVSDNQYLGVDSAGIRKNESKNIHPTVKPTKLMDYLITLGSREGDLILDPFVGSGTTCISARTLSRDFIGIERDKEYHKIAIARLKQHLEQTKLHEAQ